MSVVDLSYRTISCNSCDKTVTYQHPQDMAVTVEANPWIKNGRFVQTGDQRHFLYCSSLCEIKGIETGQHDFQEPSKVAIPQGSAQAQIAAAALAAKRAEDATKAIKTGSPVTLHQS